MKKVVIRAYVILIAIFLYLPIATLIILSFNKSKSMSVWTGFTFDWYSEMIHDRLMMNAILNTFSIALISALIATIIGTMACIGMKNMTKRVQNLLLGFNNIPLLNADIVTGISLMLSFLAFGISLGYTTILISHITFSIPYVILSVRPRMNKKTESLYAVSYTHLTLPTSDLV